MAVTTPAFNVVKPGGDRSSQAVYRELRVTNILLGEILVTLQQIRGPGLFYPGISTDPSADAENWRNDPSFGA